MSKFFILWQVTFFHSLTWLDYSKFHPLTLFEIQFIFHYPCQSNYDCTPFKVTFKKGSYHVECWGAASGKDYYNKSIGKGAYVSGTLRIIEEKTFFFYIGGAGDDGIQGTANGGYNGGGTGYDYGSGGGGGTDIRLSINSSSSRIIVAGGAGGGERVANGHGGALEGIKGQNSCEGYDVQIGSTSGTQTMGGKGGGDEDYGYGTDGGFGYGGNGRSNKDGGPGGGGGYFGGAGLTHVCSASGGSSYISGMKGCHSVPNENSITTTDNPIHYSQLVFTSPVMIPGNSLMPSYDINQQFLKSETFSEGNPGHGAIRVTILTTITCSKKFSPFQCFLIYTFICLT